MAETILIVEDEPEFAALVELWMGRAGLSDGRGRAPGPTPSAASTTSIRTS